MKKRKEGKKFSGHGLSTNNQEEVSEAVPCFALASGPLVVLHFSCQDIQNDPASERSVTDSTGARISPQRLP